MKNIAAILLSSIILFSFTDKKVKKGNDAEALSDYTNVALNIIGHVENTSFDFKIAMYRLYRDNKFVSGGNTDCFGTMELFLMRNSHYLLELSAPGFIPQKIYISTFVPDDHRKISNFDFGISLIPKEFLPEEDFCSLDVPFAIVYFNKNREFDYDKQYTEEILRMEEELTSNMSAPWNELIPELKYILNLPLV